MARLSALRQLAHKYGRNATFRVYMDRAQLTAPRATAMRSRLYSAGIELVDCPHDGLKEVVDKAITVDMFEYALDNPASSTLMLISGDRGYAPMLSRLSLRGYTVVIITPITSQAGLRLAQCHAVYEWSDQLTLLESQDYANPAQPSGTTTVQSRPMISAPGSKPLPTNKTLPEESTFFSAAAKPVSDAQPPKSTQSSESSTAILKSPKKGEHPREPIAVNPIFQTLVDILRTKRKEGIFYISFSELGAMLLKEQADVYKEAGVSRLKKYTTLALDDELIVFKSDKSGPVEIGGNRFVGLHPRML